MNTDIKPSWLRMSLNKLHALLRKREYPEDIIRRIINDVVDQRKHLRSKRIKNAVAYRLWDELLTPARSEINIVRVMKHHLGKNLHTQQDKEKMYALQEYETLIGSTVYKLRKVQTAGEYTPRQFVNFIRKETGRTIPNNGDHWTDYVSPKDKERVRTLFANLPDPKRGKRKNPFERKVAPVVYERNRAELIKHMNEEADKVHQELDMTRDEAEIARLEALLSQVQRAQNNLHTMPANIPLPSTWHGLLDMK